MPFRPLPLTLAVTAALTLAACSESPAPTLAESGGPGTPFTVATPEECSVFAQEGPVITRVEVDSARDWLDIAKTFEPFGGSPEAGFVLLDVSRPEFEALRVSGLTRGWRVSVDEALTRQERLRTQRIEAGGFQAQAISSRYPCYRTVEETYAAARGLATSFPNLATWTDIGDGWRKTRGLSGGYDLFALRLTNRATTGPKPKLVVTSAIHAREYATAELMTRFAEYLTANYGKDPDVTWMLDTQEVHLVLHTNPEGRKRAETGLSWRKNYNTTYCTTGSTKGADLNRNFAFGWGGPGASTSVCSETFRGPSAASEPETRAVQAYLDSVFPDVRGPARTDAAPADAPGLYLDVHSYSQLVLWPWGDTSTPAPNGPALQTLGRKLAYFNGYTPEQSTGLYPTSGTTIDYAYGKLGVAAYTYELGTAFFQDCASFTGTILPQNTASLLYALKTARAPYRLGSGPEPLNVSATAPSGGSFTLSARLDDTRYNNSAGTEPTQTVAGAEYFIDTPPWAGGTPLPLTAGDGAFDAGAETVTAVVGTAGLSRGRHTVYVRGTDAAGNVGVVSAVFVDVP